MNKRIRVGLIIAAGVLIIIHLTMIDYGNLSWSRNMSPYLGIIAMICIIIGMTMQIRNDKKQKAKLTDTNSQVFKCALRLVRICNPHQSDKGFAITALQLSIICNNKCIFLSEGDTIVTEIGMLVANSKQCPFFAYKVEPGWQRRGLFFINRKPYI